VLETEIYKELKHGERERATEREREIKRRLLQEK